jgi:hypothetical protein
LIAPSDFGIEKPDFAIAKPDFSIAKRDFAIAKSARAIEHLHFSIAKLSRAPPQSMISHERG